MGKKIGFVNAEREEVEERGKMRVLVIFRGV